MQKPKQNNYAFIDSQNLNLSIQTLGWKLNWQKFRRYLKDKLNVKRAFLFIGYLPSNQTLYTNLQNAGFILIFKPTLQIPGKIKGNVDAELVLYTMIEYPNYDQAVIVTGDGDFACLVEYLFKKNKLKKLIIPDKTHYSSLLRKYSSHMLFVSDLRKKLEYFTKR